MKKVSQKFASFQDLELPKKMLSNIVGGALEPCSWVDDQGNTIHGYCDSVDAEPPG